jgi:hypothetical protein
MSINAAPPPACSAPRALAAGGRSELRVKVSVRDIEAGQPGGYFMSEFSCTDGTNAEVRMIERQEKNVVPPGEARSSGRR